MQTPVPYMLEDTTALEMRYLPENWDYRYESDAGLINCSMVKTTRT